MRLWESQLKRTAYHEAGHAVMSFLMRVPLAAISIVPDETMGCMGYTESRWIPREDYSRLFPLPKCEHCGANVKVEAEPYAIVKQSERRNARDVALIHLRVLLAGDEAVSIMRGRRDPQGAEDDFEKARKIVETDFAHQSPRTRAAFFRALQLDTRDELHANWTHVEALAEALIERRHLTAEEAHREFVIRDVRRLNNPLWSSADVAAALVTFRQRWQHFAEALDE